MSWEVRYLPEVLDDFRALDGSQRILVRKAIEKVRTCIHKRGNVW